MDRSEFLRQQYLTLRDEIKETKKRTRATLGIGALGVPALHSIARTYGGDVIIVAIPALVVVISLLYLSENHALMRCGRYIRMHIEPPCTRGSGIVGWEKWLETRDESRPRMVDGLVVASALLLFGFYFFGAVWLARVYAGGKWGATEADAITAIYTIIGIPTGIYLVMNLRTSTTTVSPGSIRKLMTSYSNWRTRRGATRGGPRRVRLWARRPATGGGTSGITPAGEPAPPIIQTTD